MKLSIITVNLNNVEGLRKTADSILSQTYKNFEWIVIDGGSTDGSKELLEKLSDSISFWVSEKDSGIYNAMNKGVKHATGEYVQFLNSGDWLVSSRVLSEVFDREYKEDIIYGNIKFYDNDVWLRDFKYSPYLTLFYLIKQSLGHNSSFIQRRLLLDNHYDESLKIVADWKFFLQAAMSNRTFTYVDKFVGCFDINGISSNNITLLNQEKREVLDELCPIVLQKDIKLKYEAESYLAHTELENFIELRQKHPLLGKVLTACILVMKKI